VDTAHRLEEETQRDGWEADPHDYAIHLITAAEELWATLDAFEEAVPNADLHEFSQRVWLRRLQTVIEERRPTLKKEIRWLNAHTSHGVISGSRHDLQYAAEELITACSRPS